MYRNKYRIGKPVKEISVQAPDEYGMKGLLMDLKQTNETLEGLTRSILEDLDSSKNR
ncbi:hypothetical protein [Flagellimonas taeanensis]|uniref:hypothetical protein n=1 Tax=Flagellimonas taeanensis TaxID=1005926 RepID=UPI002E7B3AC5|nr:hypothetical protein [Allomuricauda taeanensis]